MEMAVLRVICGISEINESQVALILLSYGKMPLELDESCGYILFLLIFTLFYKKYYYYFAIVFHGIQYCVTIING